MKALVGSCSDSQVALQLPGPSRPCASEICKSLTTHRLGGGADPLLQTFMSGRFYACVASGRLHGSCLGPLPSQ